MKTDRSHEDHRGCDVLRLIWPQWQGATAEGVAELLREVPLAEARLGYAVGTGVLSCILPPHVGATEVVPGGAGRRPARPGPGGGPGC
jgi:hypothetical protein